MEYITMRRIMDRLLDNPNMKTLKLSSAAVYVKDLVSIVNIAPVLKTGFAYLTVKDYKAEIPSDFMEIKKVYLCKTDVEEDDLNHVLFEDGSLNAALDSSMIRDQYKTIYGDYVIQNNVLFTDIMEAKVEVEYTAINVDDIGFPVLPYDGSLMTAVENYIKYKHYIILSESGIVPDKLAMKAHQEYLWYIGQYVAKAEMPTYDEAVSFAHSWQRLVATKNRSVRAKNLPQFFIDNAKNK